MTDNLIFEKIVEDTDFMNVEQLNVDIEEPTLFLYEMGHGSPASWINILKSGVIFYEPFTVEPGTIDVEVDERLETHEYYLYLPEMETNNDITVCVDRNMGELVPGRTMWTETEGEPVIYKTEDGEEVLPSFVIVYEHVPFEKTANTLQELEQEVSKVVGEKVEF